MRTALLILILSIANPFKAWSAAYTPSDFAKGSEYFDVKISPTGDYIALGIIAEERRQLVILDAKTFKTLGGTRFVYPKQVGPFYWANDERLVIKSVETRSWHSEPTFLGELFAVNYDGSDGESIYGYSAGGNSTASRIKRKESTKGFAQIISFLPDDHKHILISSTPMSEDGKRLSTVEKLNIYSGSMTQVAKAPAPQAKFIADSNGELRYARGLDDDGNFLFHKYDAKEGDWSLVTDFTIGSKFNPLTFDSDDKNLFIANNGDANFIGVHRYEIATGEVHEVYTDKSVDITDLAFNDNLSSVYGMRIDNGYPEYLIFNQQAKEAQVFKSLLATFSGMKVTLTSGTENGDKWIVHVSSDSDAGTFYLFDREQMNISMLFSIFSHLPEKDMARTTAHTITASDDLGIPVYLTMPNNASGPVPLVTLVHGGPHGIRDYWSFDNEVQMLANEGYAVLRVNYRGSGGYGKAFEEAGYRNWGGRIQEDIIDATNWARSLPGVDGEKVCIMGTSFGAYSALQSSVITDDIFDCAIGNAGVYDLQNLFEDGDIPELFWGDSFLETVVGTEKQQLIAFSPTHNVEKLNIPVLIAHGKQDQRAPYSQATDLRDALDKANKQYEWFVRSSETHGFHDEENRSAYYEKVAAFLKKHLK